MNKRYPILFILLIILVMISGCFEYEEVLVLNKDSSGTMEVDLWFNKDVNIEDEDFRLSQEKEEMESDIREKYTSDKVKLIAYEMNEKGDRKHVNFKVAFNHVLDLNELKQFSENDIAFRKVNGRMNFDRTLYLNHDDTSDDEDVEEKEDEDEDPSNLLERMVLALVDEFLQDIKFRFEVITPSKIKETNSEFTTGKKRATWSYRLSDIIKDKKVTLSVTY